MKRISGYLFAARCDTNGTICLGIKYCSLPPKQFFSDDLTSRNPCLPIPVITQRCVIVIITRIKKPSVKSSSFSLLEGRKLKLEPLTPAAQFYMASTEKNYLTPEAICISFKCFVVFLKPSQNTLFYRHFSDSYRHYSSLELAWHDHCTRAKRK